MKKSKAPIFVLAILSVVMLGAGIAVYIVAPSMAGGWADTFKHADLLGSLGELPAVFGTLMGFENKELFTKFEIGVLIMDVLILAALAVLVIMWIINLILLIVKKKPIHLIPNLAWLLASGAAVILLALALVPAKQGSSFVGVLFEGSGMAKDGMVWYHDALGAIGSSISSEYGKGLGLAAGLFILILIAAYIIGLVAIIKSTGALAKEKKKKKVADEEGADEYEEDEEECESEEEKDDKRSEKAGPYIIQNFYNGAPMPYCYPPHECHCHEPKPEPKPEPEPEPCKCECCEEEDRPLTAKELRAIIREELDDREHPEEIEPLTDERAREVIQEELADYYTGKDEEEPVEEEAEDVMTADDLRKMIKEEVEGAVKPAEGLTSEEVRGIIREELGAAPKAEEPKDNLSAEEVRSIVAEELAKYLQNIAVVEEVEPKEEPAPEPEPEPEPAPEPEPEPEPAPEPAAPVIRLSFAEKVTAAPQEVKDNYNDLKAYALGYGLKSRVANGGDTFRLHTKTYFRINMVGKGLKLYYALDPKDYENSPIPVQDVGHKNLYKDIPLCFKVRSGLSVKRAKQLIDDVCGKAGLTAGAPVDTRDYAADLVNYVNDGSESTDDED
ncbi:MAG: hypothetical protein IKQ78_01485 [Bacilli bacterium]|nr:hypothetical protein [Bacilli bacterium]